MLRKVLVANRGEIAVRIIRALREMGIPSVAVFSDADRKSLHVRMADEAEHIGPAASSESYLRIDKVLDAARKHGADAIHPGYGFLSENADFADSCAAAGIKFIGPTGASIRALGSKTGGRKIAMEAGAPVVPGTKEPASSFDHAKTIALDIGYPVLLKAVAGGGGKGMRRVGSEAELESAIRDARSEAERAFNSGEVYIEKVIENPRHIEIQILGDEHGHLIHLGERECSLQRRYQKVIEECPSPLVAQHPEMRTAMGEAALKIARAAGYYNAGTAEFLVDKDRNFYFLEMNTRLQVEHPVTELVTSLDLVQWQLRIASGEHLTLKQDDITWRGSAIECRAYAEDPDSYFFPSPGPIDFLTEPAGPGIRLDSGIYEGWRVPIEYDPLLAKLAVWAADRPTAIARMLRALQEYSIIGIRTNLAFFRDILNDPQFCRGDLHTGFIAEFMDRRPPRASSEELDMIVALAAAEHYRNSRPPTDANHGGRSISSWLLEGRSRNLR
ncbi:MAG TPA: acetyl-CoA carboxylase biotin carboxylase subunit [Bryobacteraceae bacterium]|nr:acetyl-CoA carboxylase biotin carboxylase subunit [Bryobacteraceae bacterium]